jgi:hypothetical protein
VEDERGRDLKFRDPKTANRSHEDVDEVEDAANPTFIHEDGLSDDVDLRPEDVPFTKAFAILPNDVRTHRLRKHGNKPLPLSPVIDPVFVAARNRWKMTKALPPKPEEMTEFQRKLYANAYGMLHRFPSLCMDSECMGESRVANDVHSTCSSNPSPRIDLHIHPPALTLPPPALPPTLAHSTTRTNLDAHAPLGVSSLIQFLRLLQPHNRPRRPPVLH